MGEVVKTTDKIQKWINDNRKIALTIGILLIIAVIAGLILIGVYAFNTQNGFSVSPNSYLLPDRVPSNPLSYIVYPFRQLLNWDDLPTGAREMTTKQGTGKV